MMPDVSDAIRQFEETLQFQIVKKAVADHQLAQSSKVRPDLWFEGILEPLHPRELLVKTEGERKFKWWTMWSDIDLNVDWIVKDEKGISYRVMATTDWRDGGYRQYQLIEGPGL